MSNEIKVVQNTEEWFMCRLGKITASNFDTLMPSSKQKIDEFSQGQKTYLLSVAAEILTGMREETYENFAMRQGHEREPMARAALAHEVKIPIRESGFWEYSLYIGVSPDGIGGFDDFTVELKCPMPRTHMLYLYDMDEFKKKYRWQYTGQMVFSGIDHCYFGSFNPDFPDNKQLIYSGADLSDVDKDLMINRMGHAVEFVKKLIQEEPIEVEL